MSFFGHATASMLLAVLYQRVFLKEIDLTTLSIIFIIIGSLPDLLRVLFNEGWGGTYLMLHKPTQFFRYSYPKLRYIIYFLWVALPPLGAHALFDWYLHNEEGGWTDQAIYIEVLWLLFSLIVWKELVI